MLILLQLIVVGADRCSRGNHRVKECHDTMVASIAPLLHRPLDIFESGVHDSWKSMKGKFSFAVNDEEVILWSSAI